MSTSLQNPEKKEITTKEFFSQPTVRKKFEELLGQRASVFMTSVLQIVASSKDLSKADPGSVYNCAVLAATLDLPVNNQLGFAYILPYNQRQKDGSYKVVAQFQLGYRAYIQLALRSGQFHKISSAPIYEGQIVEENPLTGFVFDFKNKKSDKAIGYAAYFRLANGFEATYFMSTEDLQKHASKYSKTFKKGEGLWKDDFDAMASKTVLKLLLSKFAPLSVETRAMHMAITADSAVINNEEATDVSYVDNEETKVDKESERVLLLIEAATTLEQLESLQEFVDLDQMDAYKAKEAQLKKSAK